MTHLDLSGVSFTKTICVTVCNWVSRKCITVLYRFLWYNLHIPIAHSWKDVKKNGSVSKQNRRGNGSQKDTLTGGFNTRMSRWMFVFVFIQLVETNQYFTVCTVRDCSPVSNVRAGFWPLSLPAHDLCLCHIIASGQQIPSSLVKTVKGRWADLNTSGCYLPALSVRRTHRTCCPCFTAALHQDCFVKLGYLIRKICIYKKR